MWTVETVDGSEGGVGRGVRHSRWRSGRESEAWPAVGGRYPDPGPPASSEPRTAAVPSSRPQRDCYSTAPGDTQIHRYMSQSVTLKRPDAVYQENRKCRYRISMGDVTNQRRKLGKT